MLRRRFSVRPGCPSNRSLGALLVLVLVVFSLSLSGCRERAAFDKASREDTKESYDSYLSRYPNGKWSQQAAAAKAHLVDQESFLAGLLSLANEGMDFTVRGAQPTGGEATRLRSEIAALQRLAAKLKNAMPEMMKVVKALENLDRSLARFEEAEKEKDHQMFEKVGKPDVSVEDFKAAVQFREIQTDRHLSPTLRDRFASLFDAADELSTSWATSGARDLLTGTSHGEGQPAPAAGHSR